CARVKGVIIIYFDQW
nr:immunoglobulin heavy chain junction region [Macaca mulatta]MOV35926.1 immunoglobulin heavy chain junction region [Macaca mulatta]